MRKRQIRTIAGGAAPGSVYVDTSAWIAFFSARDQNHVQAASLFREVVARSVRLTTTNLVIAELHRLLLHRAGMVAALRTLDRIESSPRVSIVFASGSHHTAAKSYLARLPDCRISYTDAVSFAVMKESRCARFLSFDTDFLAAGFLPWTPD